MERRAVLHLGLGIQRDADAEYRAITLQIRNIGNTGARGCQWHFVLHGDLALQGMIRLVQSDMTPIEGGLEVPQNDDSEMHFKGEVHDTIYPGGFALPANLHVHKSQSEFSLLYRLLFDDGPYPERAYAVVWCTRNAEGVYELGDLIAGL